MKIVGIHPTLLSSFFDDKSQFIEGKVKFKLLAFYLLISWKVRLFIRYKVRISMNLHCTYGIHTKS